MADRSFIGRGPVLFKLRGATGGYTPIGNCSNLSVSFEEDAVEVRDYTVQGGGLANKLQTVSNVTGSVTMIDFSSQNLALALRGTATEELAGPVTAEAHTTNGLAGEFIKFDFLRDATQDVTVTGPSGTPTYVEGTDYVLQNNGITLLQGTSIDNTGVEIDYVKAASEIMEALTVSGQEYELLFNGVNEGQGGKLVSVEMHRVKFSPAQGLAFIADEFGEISVEFEMLSDDTKSGEGISKFMKIDQIA